MTMKKILLILAAAFLLTACGEETKDSAENTSGLADERVLTFQEAKDLMEGMPNLLPIPREQLGINRADDDPIEFVQAKDKLTRESITIGLYVNSEDAVEATEKKYAGIKEKENPARLEYLVYERHCNSFFYYYPGNDLANPNLREKATEIRDKWAALCKES
jgi:hypothetical protein